VPFPVPGEPEVMLIHAALLMAVHAHPVPAVTLTLPDPPEEETVLSAGAMV